MARVLGRLVLIETPYGRSALESSIAIVKPLAVRATQVANCNGEGCRVAAIASKLIDGHDGEPEPPK